MFRIRRLFVTQKQLDFVLFLRIQPVVVLNMWPMEQQILMVQMQNRFARIKMLYNFNRISIHWQLVWRHLESFHVHLKWYKNNIVIVDGTLMYVLYCRLICGWKIWWDRFIHRHEFSAVNDHTQMHWHRWLHCILNQKIVLDVVQRQVSETNHFLPNVNI